MKQGTKSTTFRLVISALMIALSTVLSLLAINLPFGGSVTLGAMVPLVVISQLYGTGWGLFTCIAYGLTQMLFGLDNFSYVTSIWAILAVVFFDYLFAYGAIGLSGVTAKMKRRSVSAALGALLGCFVRFIFHFICGAVVWGEWAELTALPSLLQSTPLAEGKWLIWSYSFFYNLSYMLPETILTAIASAIVVVVVDRLRKKENEI